MHSKLDVYKIVLNRGTRTFEDFVKKKNNLNGESSSKIFNSFYKNLLELIGTDIFCLDSKNIGLTLFKGKNRTINKILTSHSSAYVIEGFIDAGPYNSIRKLSKLSDKSKTKTINKTDIITDRYYFYLYFPLDTKIGIMMVESKENASIRRAIKPFIQSLFKIESKKGCHVIPFFPEWLKQDFVNGSNLYSMSFEQEVIAQTQTEEEFNINSEDFVVKVTIVPKSTVNNIPNSGTFIERICGMFGIKVGNDIVNLSSFSKKKGVMKNEDKKKSLPFTIDKENDIRPIIIIDNYISPNDNGEFERNELKSFCDNLLDRIKPEIYGIEHR